VVERAVEGSKIVPKVTRELSDFTSQIRFHNHSPVRCPVNVRIDSNGDDNGDGDDSQSG
jgi:hypothetical protein